MKSFVFSQLENISERNLVAFERETLRNELLQLRSTIDRLKRPIQQ